MTRGQKKAQYWAHQRGLKAAEKAREKAAQVHPQGQQVKSKPVLPRQPVAYTVPTGCVALKLFDVPPSATLGFTPPWFPKGWEDLGLRETTPLAWSVGVSTVGLPLASVKKAMKAQLVEIISRKGICFVPIPSSCCNPAFLPMWQVMPLAKALVSPSCGEPPGLGGKMEILTSVWGAIAKGGNDDLYRAFRPWFS